MINNKEEISKAIYALIGGFLFALAVNLFIVPLNLYSGGVIGIAQIIRTLLSQTTFISFPQGVDIAGVINFAINIPLFIMAYRSISRKFFLRTLLCVLGQTIAFTLIKIPSTPIIDDVLAACLIGGLLGGFGIGLALRNGGSGGGLDILGVYFTKKTDFLSVGKLSNIINVVIFTCCALLFNVSIAIYSVIFTACMYLVVDKTHYQNINMTAMIFTKSEKVQAAILKETRRGVTYWKGAGAYTNNDTFILVTVISKYEVAQIKKIILSNDPNAFIIFNEGMSISGNFEKRL
ncbi:MAG: YitT family protein [Longicatena sp.]